MQKDPLQALDLRTESGEPYEIPVEGSLGLLALGYVGLMAWREKRRQSTLMNQPANPTLEDSEGEGEQKCNE